MKYIALNLKNRKAQDTFKNLFLKILLGFFCYILISQSEISRQSILYGIRICLNTLVPSLFPFIILASFIANSEIFEKPNKIISKITEKLFFLPGYTYSAIILSFIGGYPVGAKAIKILYEKEKINTEQLNRMMCFCVNSGPAFTVSMLGGVLLNNKKIGLTIFLIQVIIGFSIGISLGIKSRKSHKEFYFLNHKSSHKKDNIQEAFVNSVSSGCKSIIEMCGIIIVFIAFINMLGSFRIFDFILANLPYISKPILETILNSILEVTYGCICAAKNSVPYIFTAFAIGHGGICTHLQIASILKNTNFKYSKFFIFRFINAIFSAIIFYITSYFFPIACPAFSSMTKMQSILKPSSNPIGSIALITLCFYFLADLKLNKNCQNN